MSILEAMYYEKPVYVIHAPGPNDIVENGQNGFLFDSVSEMSEMIVKNKDEIKIGKEAHKRIMEHFLWDKAVETIKNQMQ